MESIAARQAPPATPATLRLVRDASDLLPDPLSTFIGRDAELREVARLLDGTRLLSLTGAGGSGKTRLALDAASTLLEMYDDGMFFVALAPVDEPGLVGVVRYPDTHRWGEAEPRPVEESLQGLEDVIRYEGPQTIAGVFLETVVGTNGILVPPEGYLAGIRQIWRTPPGVTAGRLWRRVASASDRSGAQPD